MTYLMNVFSVSERKELIIVAVLILFLFVLATKPQYVILFVCGVMLYIAGMWLLTLGMLGKVIILVVTVLFIFFIITRKH